MFEELENVFRTKDTYAYRFPFSSCAPNKPPAKDAAKNLLKISDAQIHELDTLVTTWFFSRFVDLFSDEESAFVYNSGSGNRVQISILQISALTARIGRELAFLRSFSDTTVQSLTSVVAREKNARLLLSTLAAEDCGGGENEERKNAASM